MRDACWISIGAPANSPSSASAFLVSPTSAWMSLQCDHAAPGGHLAGEGSTETQKSLGGDASLNDDADADDDGIDDGIDDDDGVAAVIAGEALVPLLPLAVARASLSAAWPLTIGTAVGTAGPCGMVC